MANYYSRYTGEQIDDAIGDIINKKYALSNTPGITVNADGDITLYTPNLVDAYIIMTENGIVGTYYKTPNTHYTPIGNMKDYAGEYVWAESIDINEDDRVPSNVIYKPFKLGTPRLRFSNPYIYVDNADDIVADLKQNVNKSEIYIELFWNGEGVGFSPSLYDFQDGAGVDISPVLDDLGSTGDVFNLNVRAVTYDDGDNYLKYVKPSELSNTIAAEY